MSKRKYIIMFSSALVFVAMILSYNRDVSTSTELSDSNWVTYNYDIAENNCQKTPSQLTEVTITHINKMEIQEIEGTEVIGKLQIPEINLTTYILAETSKETLNKSVTKLCGPKVNGVGNLCITGHNYHKKYMFGNLNKLELNDKIYLTGINGNTVEYVVYDIYTVYPKELECLSQETEGERQITLITCTTGAIKRLIVKATEVYD